MANHKSSIKRIRQIQRKKLHNRYYAKTARNAVRKLRATTEKTVAAEFLPRISLNRFLILSFDNIPLRELSCFAGANLLVFSVTSLVVAII